MIFPKARVQFRVIQVALSSIHLTPLFKLIIAEAAIVAGII